MPSMNELDSVSSAPGSKGTNVNQPWKMPCLSPDSEMLPALQSFSHLRQAAAVGWRFLDRIVAVNGRSVSTQEDSMCEPDKTCRAAGEFPKQHPSDSQMSRACNEAARVGVADSPGYCPRAASHHLHSVAQPAWWKCMLDSQDTCSRSLRLCCAEGTGRAPHRTSRSRSICRGSFCISVHV